MVVAIQAMTDIKSDGIDSIAQQSFLPEKMSSTVSSNRDVGRKLMACDTSYHWLSLCEGDVNHRNGDESLN